jgi:hypothetical protein
MVNDDLIKIKQIKNATNKKISNLTKDFNECAKLIDDIKTTSAVEIPKQLNDLKKYLEKNLNFNAIKSMHQSRFEINNNNNKNNNNKSVSQSPPPPMYRYYNPSSVSVHTDNELSRSLSPDDRVKLLNGKDSELSPRLLFIKNSLTEVPKARKTKVRLVVDPVKEEKKGELLNIKAFEMCTIFFEETVKLSMNASRSHSFKVVLLDQYLEITLFIMHFF